MIKKLLLELAKQNVNFTENFKSAVQHGNYCYLIAGVELLLANKLFMQFIYFYPDRNKLEFADDEDIAPLCRELQNYIKTKQTDLSVYKNLEKIIFESLDIKNYGEAEDCNVVFLYFQKSKLYCCLFSEIEYIIDKLPQPIAAPCGVFVIISDKKITWDPRERCNEFGVYSIAVRAAGHYEVFQRVMCNYKKIPIFIPKNTNYLLPGPWDILVIFCTWQAIKKITLLD